MKDIEQVLRYFQINLKKEEKITDTAVLINDVYVVKMNTSLLETQKNYSISKALKDHGVPTSDYIEVDQKYFCEVDGNYFTITKRIEGQHLTLEDLDEEMSKETGKIMAKLHASLNEIHPLHEMDFLSELTGWIKDALDSTDMKYAAISHYHSYLEKLNKIYVHLPRTNIHRDFHLGNFLVHQKKLVGIIDYDISQNNIRMFDIAYFSVGLLAAGMPYEKWLKVHQWIMDGYKSVSELSKEEIEGCLLLMMGIEILFVAYFIKMKNHELASNADQTFIKLWEEVYES